MVPQDKGSLNIMLPLQLTQISSVALLQTAVASSITNGSLLNWLGSRLKQTAFQESESPLFLIFYFLLTVCNAGKITIINSWRTTSPVAYFQRMRHSCTVNHPKYCCKEKLICIGHWTATEVMNEFTLVTDHLLSWWIRYPYIVAVFLQNRK